MKLHELHESSSLHKASLLENDIKAINEGLGRDSIVFLKGIGATLLGAGIGATGAIVGSAWNVYTQWQGAFSISFWDALQMVLVDQGIISSSITFAAISSVTVPSLVSFLLPFGILSGALVSLMYYVGDVQEKSIKTKLTTLDRLVEKRDSAIQSFVSTEHERDFMQISELNSRIDNVAQEIQQIIQNDSELMGIIEYTDDISNVDKKTLKTFMSASDTSKSRYDSLITKLDSNTIEQAKQIINRKIAEAKVPNE